MADASQTTHKQPYPLCETSADKHNGAFRRSAGLDSEDLIADLHEGEEINFVWDVTLLCLREVILAVSQGLQSYSQLTV